MLRLGQELHFLKSGEEVRLFVFQVGCWDIWVVGVYWQGFFL